MCGPRLSRGRGVGRRVSGEGDCRRLSAHIWSVASVSEVIHRWLKSELLATFPISKIQRMIGDVMVIFGVYSPLGSVEKDIDRCGASVGVPTAQTYNTDQ